MTDFTLALCVTQLADTRYGLITLYDEVDPLNAVGQVVATVGTEPGAPSRCVLNTGHPLANMWQSPEGSLWVSSSDGHVFTTAPVDWPRDPQARFDDNGSGLPWRTVLLPMLRRNRHPPVLTVIGGTSDKEVFAATSSGAIYNWQGRSWIEQETPSQDSLVRIVAVPGHPLFALGDRGALLRLEGQRWHAIVLPDTEDAVLTGGAFLPDGSLLVCSTKGQVLRVMPDGSSSLFASADAKFFGIAMLGDRAMLAASPIGAWELSLDGALQPVRDTFAAVNLVEAGGRLYFVLSEQPHGPSFVVHEPQTGAWYGWKIA